jgi:hypothetical protein
MASSATAADVLLSPLRHAFCMVLSKKKRILFGGALGLLLLAALGVIWRIARQQPQIPLDASRSAVTLKQDQTVNVLVASEELLLALTPVLQRLNKSIQNLRLPDPNSHSLFFDSVQVIDVDDVDPPQHYLSLPTVEANVFKWHGSHSPSTVAVQEASWWRPLLDAVDYFTFAKFYFIRAEFLDDARTQWQAKVGFEGLARTTEGNWRVMKGTLNTLWRKRPGSNADVASQWGIARFELNEMKTYESPRKLFREVLDDAIPDLATRRRARKSIHDELIVKAVENPDFQLPTKYFDHRAFDRHPGVSVVDIDRDGFDDLYAMDQWGKNLLLRNRGDGTFEDIAAEVGLDLENHCTSAIFADFDNDGDPDVFIGRTLERSRYFVNEGGRFADRSESLVSVPLPYLVSSIAAADYNNDGLLDVYFSTYAGDTIDRQITIWPNDPARRAPNGQWMLLPEFLPQADAIHLMRLYERQHDYFGRVGPPNLLLVNRGERFEVSPADKQVQVWRNTYQSTWGDFDNDGDPDLYCANDFSFNNLFRNNGDGTFTDVTAETGTADIGFGMGAAWGDYDNDGRQDLYVTNMYSKAGQRITESLGTVVDPKFRKMAEGNSLFCNLGSHFKKVSGEGPSDLAVEIAGWSWGGQFLDVDNDGYLDIFATSGYYSAPQQVAVQVDL